MKQKEAEGIFTGLWMDVMELRKQGNKEYAHSEDTLANFKRVAERTGITPEQVLMVYAEKHIDGIHSYISGHKSQREGVIGRINDLVVYMGLLRCLIEERSGDTPTA